MNRSLMFRFYVITLLSLSGLSSSPSNVLAARPDSERGKSYIDYFSPRDYGADNQNWWIVQDPQGLIYVANNLGILAYDGVSWRLIETTNRNTVRSLAVSTAGHIFVGSDNELGYLRPDSLGQLQYRSLKDQLPPHHQGFDDVWNSFTLPEGIYFQPSHTIFRFPQNTFPLTKEHLAIWSFDTPHILRSFRVDRDYYVFQRKQALFKMEQDSLTLVCDDARLKQTKVDVLLPYDGDTLLLGTRDKGLFLLHGSTLRRFDCPASDFVKSGNLYQGVQTSAGDYVLTTLNQGAIRMSKGGQITQAVNKKTGLPLDTVLCSFVDDQQNVWLGLDSGVARVEMFSPFSYFDKDLGLESPVLSLHRHQGVLWAGHGTGISRLVRRKQDASGTPAHFEPVPGIDGYTFAMVSVGQDLLVSSRLGTQHGIFQIRDNDVRLVRPYPQYVNSLIQSKQDSTRLYAGIGQNYGVEALRWHNQQLRVEAKVNLPASGYQLVEMPDGRLWIGAAGNHLFRVDFSQLDQPKLETFGPKEGLPSGMNYVYFIRDIRVGTYSGLFRFEESTERFVPDSTFGARFADPNRHIHSLTEDEEGHIWIGSSVDNQPEVHQLRQRADGSWQVLAKPFRRINAMLSFTDYTLFHEPDGVTWLKSSKGLIRYDAGVEQQTERIYPVHIRRVTVNSDSLLFGGYEGPFKRIQGSEPVLDYQHNSCRFEYAAPVFDDPGALRFQVMLENFDRTWSKWTDEIRKDYTHLPEGRYTFRVRARDIYGNISREDTFAFEILPPWYRSGGAYGIYLILGMVLIWGIVKLNTIRLVKDKKQLEAIVRERTVEVVHQKEAIEAQSVELQKAYKNVQMLSDIGREITANLSLFKIVETVYHYVNLLMDATEFGVGLIDEERQELVFKDYIYQGQQAPEVRVSLANKNRLAVHCVLTRVDIILGDIQAEYTTHVPVLEGYREGELLNSVICIPLMKGAKPIGVVSVQSQRKNAYTENQVNILRSIAAYLNVALENSTSYAKIEEQKNQLIALDDFKQGMISMIVHDLKNPLNVILTSLSAHSMRSQVNTMKNSARQMLTMVLNILDVQKFEDARVELDTRPCVLFDLADAAIQQIEYLSHQKSITISNAIPRHIVVKVDFELVKRIFVNLLTNGIKFTPNNGRITIAIPSDESDRVSGFIPVEVSDTGEGIPPDKLDLVFDKFTQARAKHSGSVRSTGLGLSLCKLAVEAHRGQIKVASAIGEGTTFTFTLPELPVASPPVESDQKAVETADRATTIVLSAEEQAVLAPYADILKKRMVYEASEVAAILGQIEAGDKENLHQWKTAMQDAVYAMNEEKYAQLLNLVDWSPK